LPIVPINGNLAFVKLEINSTEIPRLLVRHAKRYPGSDQLEMCGAALVAAAFPLDAAASFVNQVCLWGGGDRFVDRVLHDNGMKEIADALDEGYQKAQCGEVSAGVERIRRLKFLGQSFASKQLRFLAPTRAVILDDSIRSNLGYEDTAQGYDAFLSDCREILKHAQAQRVLRPCGRPLRIADIEAAVFAKIRGF
jgi:Putative 8-oxoguanine DNA glycosylase OGG-like protein